MLPLQAPEIYPKTQQAKSNRVPKFKQRPFVTKCQQPKLSQPSFLLLHCSRCSCCYRCYRCYRCSRYSWPSPQPWPHQSAQKCRFCARNARKRGSRRPKKHKNLDFVLEMPGNEGFRPQKRTKTPILCSGRLGLAPGREIIGIGKHNRRDVYPSCKSPRTLPKYKYLITK